MSAVSVALCTYNGARYLPEQVASILDQEPPPAELVVADDASADDSVAVVRSLAESRDGLRLTVLESTEPLGVTANFERAVAAADGELVALSDQDDRWHPGRLARVVALFAADPSLTLLHTDARLVDADGRDLGRTLFQWLEVAEEELALEESGRAYLALLRRNLATGATVVFRRELLEVARPFPPEWVHDEWLAALAAATGRVGVLREATIDYRLHGENQIGVTRPTLRYKIGRVLQPRGDRNALLARRFAILAERLAALGDRVAPDDLRLAREKAAFEAERAALPPARVRRIGRVLRLWRTGAYRRFASRGTKDVLRDLFQPA